MFTIAPPPVRRIAAISCLRQARTPSRFVAMTDAKLAASLASMATRVLDPPHCSPRSAAPGQGNPATVSPTRPSRPRPPARRRRARRCRARPGRGCPPPSRHPAPASMSFTTTLAPPGGEILRDRPAAAAARPRDERDPPGKVVHRCYRRWSCATSAIRLSCSSAQAKLTLEVRPHAGHGRLGVGARENRLDVASSSSKQASHPMSGPAGPSSRSSPGGRARS